MDSPLKTRILSFLVFAIFVISCQSNNPKPELIESITSDKKESKLNPEEEEIKATVERLLIAAGNYNLKALDEMVLENANLGISSLKDGTWSNSVITINEYFENVKARKPLPYCEIVSEYNIKISKGQLAVVIADAIVHRFGIPLTHEINHFTLLKENGIWKFLNISFTVNQIPEEIRKFDLDIFARGYAQAWGSKRPEFVASYFAEDGSLRVNDGDPAIGRDEISKVAQGFMTDLPDMIVRYDSLVSKSNGMEFHWTLIATNSGPGGTGNKVKVSGFELWQIDDNGFIKSSQGHFPTQKYNRQIEFGFEN